MQDKSSVYIIVFPPVVARRRNKVARAVLYKRYRFLEQGITGNRPRIRPPKCIDELIRSIPDPHGIYLDFDAWDAKCALYFRSLGLNEDDTDGEPDDDW